MADGAGLGMGMAGGGGGHCGTGTGTGTRIGHSMVVGPSEGREHTHTLNGDGDSNALCSPSPYTQLTNTATSVKSKRPSDETATTTSLLPILALLAAQLITASWHVLGKHVLRQVPYLDPISFVFFRTLLASVALFLVGRLREGYVPFPSLYRDGNNNFLGQQKLICTQPTSPIIELERGFSFSSTLSLSSPDSVHSVDNKFPTHRKKRRRKKHNSHILASLYPRISSMILLTFKVYRQLTNSLNPEAIRIIFAGISGMIILPLCYTTGLILTSPTVVSVWDGPLIPLGCFVAAVAFGIESLSDVYPFAQVGSLLLTVSGSIVVLLVDYSGVGRMVGGHEDVVVYGSSFSDHTNFLRGNIILMGVVAATSALTLLQKSLSHYPSIQLTAWMFGIGFVGCFALLLFDGMMGSTITGCSLRQAVLQLWFALTTSSTFRFGVVYSALFVNGACFTIGSYASSHLDSSVITLFAVTQPPLTAVLEWFWEGSELGWMKLAGMASVCLGIYSFTWIKRRS